jgi:hypothetical protein
MYVCTRIPLPVLTPPYDHRPPPIPISKPYKFHDELLDVEEKESVAAEKESRDKALEETLTQLESAGIVFAHTIFDDMFSDDSELERLKHLPGVKDTIEAFRTSFKAQSEEFIREGMAVYAVKKADMDAFDAAVAAVRNADDTESRLLIEEYNRNKKSAMMVFGEHSERQATVTKLQAELDRVCDELMSIELRQVEKFEKVATQCACGIQRTERERALFLCIPQARTNVCLCRRTYIQHH